MVERNRSEVGQALVEFAICMVTFLFVLLGIIQLILFLNAQTAVRYAAFSAARSAIVTGGDKDKMMDAVRVALLPIFPRHGNTLTPLNVMTSYLGAKKVDTNPSYGSKTLGGGAITEVSIVNPTFGVTFDDHNHAGYSGLTVKVVHQYELIIPIVNAILDAALRLHFRGEKMETPDELLKLAAKHKVNRQFFTGYRIPIVAYYSMNLENDLGDR